MFKKSLIIAIAMTMFCSNAFARHEHAEPFAEPTVNYHHHDKKEKEFYEACEKKHISKTDVCFYSAGTGVAMIVASYLLPSEALSQKTKSDLNNAGWVLFSASGVMGITVAAHEHLRAMINKK